MIALRHGNFPLQHYNPITRFRQDFLAYAQVSLDRSHICFLKEVEMSFLSKATPARRLVTPGPGTKRKKKKDKTLRRLGVLGIIFQVVSAAAPMTTAAVAVPTTMAVTKNIGMPLFYLIAGAVLLIFSVGFTAMSRHVHQAGAFFSYIRAGLGRVVGSGAATVALVSYYLLQVSLLVFLGVGTSMVVEAVSGVVLPWGPLSLIHVIIIGLLGYRNIDVSSRVLAVLLTVETAVVLTVDLAVGLAGGHAGITLAPFDPAVFQQGAAPVALMFAFLGFIGFEATAVFRNEAKKPEKTIPRATYLSVIIIAVFYALTSWMIVVAEGPEGVIASAAGDPSTLFARIAGRFTFPAFVGLVQVLIITSVFAAALSFHNVIGRYQFSLAQARVLPKYLAFLDPKHDSPSQASLVTTGVSVILTALSASTGLQPLLQINAWLSGVGTLGIVILMTLTSVAVVVFFHRTKREPNRWKAVIAPVFSAVALFAVTCVVIGNFVLIVGDAAVATVLEGVIAVAFIIGMLVAVRLRRRQPEVYELLKPPLPYQTPALASTFANKE
jgi:amino acid transporter